MAESLIMIIDSLELIPQFNLPDGFRIRNYKIGDYSIWADILTKSGLFKSNTEAIERFNLEFKNFENGMTDRCFIIQNNSGEDIGTATAWYNHNFNNDNYGRIHWVGIIPEYQGKGLAKPLMTTTMNKLKEYHQKAYLKTHEDKKAAIKLYELFGFRRRIF